MDIKTFHLLFGEAITSNDRDAFISDWSLSSIWEDSPESDIPPERISQLVSIWDAAHRSVREIAALSGLSQRKLAERFFIPYRTMEDWCLGLHVPPDHVRLMMQECLGLVDR